MASSTVTAPVPAPEAPECPVCYEPCGTNAKLTCGHGLCAGCESLIRAAPRHQGGQRCPLCRADFNPAPAEVTALLNVPERVAARRRLMDTINALRDRITETRRAHNQELAQLNQQMGERLLEFTELMRDQGFADGWLTVAGNRIYIPPAAPALAASAVAAAVAADAAAPVILTRTYVRPVAAAAAPAPAQTYAQQARAAGQTGHACGHRYCRSHDATLVDLPGFTRRVWRCALHNH